jgi:hypothetical protein
MVSSTPFVTEPALHTTCHSPEHLSALYQSQFSCRPTKVSQHFTVPFFAPGKRISGEELKLHAFLMSEHLKVSGELHVPITLPPQKDPRIPNVKRRHW